MTEHKPHMCVVHYTISHVLLWKKFNLHSVKEDTQCYYTRFVVYYRTSNYNVFGMVDKIVCNSMIDELNISSICNSIKVLVQTNISLLNSD